MATLSLNTSITSTHKDDFYSGTYSDGSYDWSAILNLYGNYFTDVGTPVPCEYMTFDGKVKGVWTGISPGCDLCGYYSYAYCSFNWIYAFYYDFSNPSNPDNYYFLEKIAVIYGGMSAESFINRTTLNIKTTDISGSPLQGCKIDIMPYYTDYIVWSGTITLTSDSTGNASTTFFNPPHYPWNSSSYRMYYIVANKTGYKSSYVDETIPNQQTYPSTGSVNLQLSISCTIPSAALTLS